MDISSCFLFVGQHALCLQRVEGCCAASWTVAWWSEEVQVVAEESGNLQQNSDITSAIIKKKRASLAKATLINACLHISMQILGILFSLKLTSVFTAQRWLHHQVSRMINVWAIKLFACRDDHSENAAHRTVPPISSRHILSQRFTWSTKRNHFIPLLWLGSSCTNCELDGIFEHLTAAHLSPVVLWWWKWPTWSSGGEI